jgi:iron complex transport system substrate-binding protein
MAVTVSTLACTAPPPDSSQGLVDDTGRPIRLGHTVNRIVSLAPSITELLFDLGLERRVVGRTRWDDYPPQVAAVPNVGDGLSPNVEMILAQQPDLVVFYASGSNESAITRLDALGVVTISLRTDRLTDLERAARVLGRLTGTSAIADSLIARLAAEMDTLRSSRQREDGMHVLILPSDNPPIAVGAASFLSEIVSLAGGRNVFADVDRPSLNTSIEAIARRNPDVVLVASDSGVPEWANRPEWQSVPAVRDRRFVVVSGSEFSRPSFRAPTAVRRLQAALEYWLP